MKRLLWALSPFAAGALLWLTLGAAGNPNDAFFPSISVRDTNFMAEAVITNGATLGGVRRTTWPTGGGAAMTGTVSNNVASAGLLAVDATKTNGIAATSAHVQASLGSVFQPTNSILQMISTNSTPKQAVTNMLAATGSSADVLLGNGNWGVVAFANTTNSLAAPNDTAVFLNGKGLWAAPPGGGSAPVGTVVNTTSGNAGNVLVMTGTNPTNTVPTNALSLVTLTNTGLTALTMASSTNGDSIAAAIYPDDTTRGPFRLLSGQTLFSSTWDTVGMVGWNFTSGGSKIVSTESAEGMYFENDYWDGAKHVGEMYWQFAPSNSTTVTRPIFLQFDRNGGTINAFELRGGVQFTSAQNATNYAIIAPDSVTAYVPIKFRTGSTVYTTIQGNDGNYIQLDGSTPTNNAVVRFLSHTTKYSGLIWCDGSNNPQWYLTRDANQRTMSFYAQLGINKAMMRLDTNGFCAIGPDVPVQPSSTLQVVGSMARSLAFSGGGSMTDTNDVVMIVVDGVTVTNETAVGHRGRTRLFKTWSPASTATVTNAPGETIDGALSYSLTASNKFVSMISNGTNWCIIGNN